ncbi:MAG: hypothetical protein CSA22_02165 [Deltaproteobacteria bacterium]|nr:MAG: hypothetical protein CSA22_02165 [Deltaproteobacteria bacterium]
MDLILPGIYRITQNNRWGAFKPPVNLYVLADSENALLFDAGYGRRRDVLHAVRELDAIKHIEASRGRAFRLGRILPSHSHADHFSGATPLKQKTGARILLTDEMARVLRSKAAYATAYRDPGTRKSASFSRLHSALNRIVDAVFGQLFGISYVPAADEIIAVGDTLSAGGRSWKVIALPGHCSDHIGLYAATDGILIAGDHVLRTITPWLGPPRSSLTDYSRSLFSLLKLPKLSCILTAHGSPVWEPEKRIRELIRHREHRTRQILSIVNAHPDGICLETIIRKQAGRSDALSRYLGEGWIRLTLMHLETIGSITWCPDTSRYHPSGTHPEFPLIPLSDTDAGLQ